MSMEKYLKPRFLVMVACAGYAVVFCKVEERLALPGISLIAAGAGIRLWANGYAVKSTRLTTSGPYAFVRHPLYLGTMLVFWGFMALCDSLLAGAVFFIALAAAYYETIKEEERHLAHMFGGEFLDYKSSVPAFMPCIRPYKRGVKWGFDSRRIFSLHKEHRVLIGIIALMLGFYFKHEIPLPQFLTFVR